MHSSGVGGLATAVAAVDSGLAVVVAEPAGIEVEDDETNRYFRDLSQGLLVGARSAAAGARRPVRVVDDLAPAVSRPRHVEPFIGSGLQDWATHCLVSPVLVSTGGHDAGAGLVCDVPEAATLQVSVLRLAPSRFGRVELLTTQVPVGIPRATCGATNRHLLDTARGTRQSQSPNWRCGELHRYPPLGK